METVDKFFGKNVKLEDVAVLYSEIIKKLNEIAEIKRSIDKVKIPHCVSEISNIVYTVKYGTLDWVKDADNKAALSELNLATDINTVIFKHHHPNGIHFIMQPVKNTVVRKKKSWEIEFVADIPDA